MGLFDAIAISSSLSLIAGVCILLEAWCLMSETKDRKGFLLAWALLAQFALPVLLTWLCREGVVPFRPAYLLLEYAVSLPAAAAVLAALSCWRRTVTGFPSLRSTESGPLSSPPGRSCCSWRFTDRFSTDLLFLPRNINGCPLRWFPCVLPSRRNAGWFRRRFRSWRSACR